MRHSGQISSEKENRSYRDLTSFRSKQPSAFFICGLAGSRIVGTEANFAVKRDWSLISQRESTSFNLFKSLHGQNRVIIGILSN